MMDYTGSLYANPSFLEGFARIFDFGGTLNRYNNGESSEEADYYALKSDLLAIREDFRESVRRGAAEPSDDE